MSTNRLAGKTFRKHKWIWVKGRRGWCCLLCGAMRTTEQIGKLQRAVFTAGASQFRKTPRCNAILTTDP